MNKQQANREAHLAVASFLEVNLFLDSDLLSWTEGLAEADYDRVQAAIERIIQYHQHQASRASHERRRGR